MARSLKDMPPIAQVVILSALAVVLVGVPSYFLVYPLFEQRSKLEKQVSDLKTENKKNQAFEQKQSEYRIRIAGLESQLQNLRSMVPDEQSTDDIMKTVFRTAGDAGVHVRTFIAQPQIAKDYYVEMPFRIHVDGTYWAMVNYFDRLAHEQRIISVTSIGLGPPIGGGMGNYEVTSAETMAANCTVTTYFNRPPQAAVAAPATK